LNAALTSALLDVYLGLPFFFGGGLLALATIFFVVFVRNRKTREKGEKSIKAVAPLIVDKLD